MARGHDRAALVGDPAPEITARLPPGAGRRTAGPCDGPRRTRGQGRMPRRWRAGRGEPAAPGGKPKLGQRLRSHPCGPPRARHAAVIRDLPGSIPVPARPRRAGKARASAPCAPAMWRNGCPASRNCPARAGLDRRAGPGRLRTATARGPDPCPCAPPHPAPPRRRGFAAPLRARRDPLRERDPRPAAPAASCPPLRRRCCPAPPSPRSVADRTHSDIPAPLGDGSGRMAAGLRPQSHTIAPPPPTTDRKAPPSPPVPTPRRT